MKEIVFATNNKHKLDEVRAILSGKVEVLSLSDINCQDEIPETANTLEGNATLKARYIYEKYGVDCFADDTGLEIEALEGRPGVYSARYAGEPSNSERNMQKVLQEMSDQNNRNARFRTVISYVEKGEYHLFEGIIEGEISRMPQGERGFGYDPIFIPIEHTKSFAELSSEEKNAISHRARATRRFADYFGD